jgi:hypothetical protein
VAQWLYKCCAECACLDVLSGCCRCCVCVLRGVELVSGVDASILLSLVCCQIEWTVGNIII